ncbi:hypothetical protein CW304_13825 [Bacillus sp. UFRGS-B20]|nr:hypothetical protein CW304_13825 [Bacillus sp. UFRGS-B20]
MNFIRHCLIIFYLNSSCCFSMTGHRNQIHFLFPFVIRSLESLYIFSQIRTTILPFVYSFQIVLNPIDSNRFNRL